MKRNKIQFKSYISDFQPKLRDHYVRNLTEAALIWERAIKKRLGNSPPRSGKVYRIPGTKNVRYTASKAGESPALALGALRASYSSEVSREALSTYLGTELDYGLHLERGTKHMEPRPAIQPALDDAKDQIIAAMTRGL